MLIGFKNSGLDLSDEDLETFKKLNKEKSGYIINFDKNIRNISRITDIKKFDIYNTKNNIVNVAKNDFFKIVYYVIEYDNITDYTNKKNGENKKYTFYINPFSCYNSFNKDKLFFPTDKNIIIE